MAKRGLDLISNSESPRTPKKTKYTPGTPSKLGLTSEITTPSQPRSILKQTSVTAQESPSVKASTNGKVLFKEKISATAKANRNDASAKKKSRAILQKEAIADDSEIDETDLTLAEEVLNDDESAEDVGDDTPQPEQDVPIKRGRGRPKGSKRARTPTPPPDMPPQEMYFFKNRTTAGKTSSNVLPSHLLLNHEDYLEHIKSYLDPHMADIQRLKQLHLRAFGQWQFELEENFSICLYGYGSKRNLLMDFANFLHEYSSPRIIVINGYIQTLTVKDIILSLAGEVIKDTKAPSQINALFDAVLHALDRVESRLYLLIHNIDSSGLRKPAIQAMLARIASHHNVSLITSCDNLNFGLLWDLNLLRQYNFAFHDATTFEPWTAEVDSVEEVNVLLGRSSRRLTGKDGVGYVLRSLPENARNLFKILVTEQLTLDIEYAEPSEEQVVDEDEEDMLGVSDEELAIQQDTPSKRGRGRPAKKTKPVKTKIQQQQQQQSVVEGIEYRTLYHKAIEDFVCSSEVNFRTLLKEFHDHQMIESHKDLMGVERLIVPFRREELETILEEL